MNRLWSGLLVGITIGAVVASLVVILLPAPGDDVEPPTDEPLIIVSSIDESADKQREQLIEKWNGTHQQQARILSLPSWADKAHAAMLEYAQGTRGQVDIYNLDVTWIAEFAAGGYIVPLPGGPIDRPAFLENPLKTCEYGDKLWCLPFNTDAGLLYYRQDLVESPPSTLVGISNAVERVRTLPAARRDRIEAGYVGQFDDYEGRTVNALEAIWAAGGDVVDGDRIVIKSEEAQSWLRWLASGLAQQGPVPLILPESRSFAEQQSTQAFAEGRTVFLRNWPVAYRTVFRPAPTHPRSRSASPSCPTVTACSAVKTSRCRASPPARGRPASSSTSSPAS